MTPIPVLCVDDSVDLLHVLRFMIDRTPDLACVGTLETAADLPGQVERHGAQVVVLDLGIPNCDALGQLRDLKRSGSAAKTIVFSGNNDNDIVDRSFDAGADACIRKGSDPMTIIETIRRVVQEQAG